MLATPELIREAAQSQRLAAVLPNYLKRVPLYRDSASYRLPDQISSLTDRELAGLPLITKQDIRRGFPANFLGPNVQLEPLLEAHALELEHTSGTSDQRTPLLLPCNWWAEQEKRALQLNPTIARVLARHPSARRVTLSSPMCSSEICYQGVPSREERTLGNSLFLSLSRFPFLWKQSELARMVVETRDWQPQFLDLDPVYGVAFALYCEARGIRFPSLSFILCTYEYVSVTHRRILERAFGVPVFDLYGSTETGHLLIQDLEGQMQASLDTAFLELIQADTRGIGELVVTTLSNEVMPLVRYRIGDLAQRFEKASGTRYVLHGRAADAFITAKGRVTTRDVDQCFLGIEGIAHYQLLQRPSNEWLVRLVPEPSGPPARAVAQLQARLGGLLSASGKIQVETTDLLLPEVSGKFRLGYPLPSPVP